MLKELRGFRDSVYSMLLTYFIGVIMLMSMVFLTINTVSSNVVKKDAIESHAEKIEFYFRMIEADIERLTLLQQEYINDNDLQKISGQYKIMSDYERIVAMKNIKHHLSWTNIYSDIIAETSVYMPRINRMISSREGLIDTTDMDMSFLLDNSSFMVNQIIERNGQLMVIVPYYENSYTKGAPKFVSYFQIADHWLTEQLDNVSQFNGSTVVLMHENRSWLRTSSNTESENSRLFEYGQSLMDNLGESPVSLGSGETNKVVRHSEKLNLILYADIPESIAIQEIRNYRIYIALFSFAMFLLTGIYSRVIYKNINEPLIMLVNGMKRVEAGNLNVSIETGRKDELGYLIKRFNKMCKRLRDTIEQVYEEQLHTRQAELKQLQYQINPHYLYNSLYMIRRMAVRKDTENIEKFSRHLGQYYEYITRINDDRAPLSVEIGHATNYLEVQMMRFGSRISVDLEQLNPKWENISVPKLIIQPILENAYNQGLERKRKGSIKLYYRETKEYLEIHVFNSGDITDRDIEKINRRIRQEYSEMTVITGLMNVHRRLQILYGKECGVSLVRKEMGVDVMIIVRKFLDLDIERRIPENV